MNKFQLNLLGFTFVTWMVVGVLLCAALTKYLMEPLCPPDDEDEHVTDVVVRR